MDKIIPAAVYKHINSDNENYPNSLVSALFIRILVGLQSIKHDGFADPKINYK